tara:strand:+ start:593 stop:976 length:384 start_codon:yes stop_codon:yes gene_type:complete
MIKLGIVGFGYWGKSLVTNFNNLSSCELKYVCENNPSNAKKYSSLCPNVNVVDNLKILMYEKEITGIAANPLDTHYNLTKIAFENGKNVLVEKPLTNSFNESKEWVELGKKKGKLFIVDHTFCIQIL